MATSDELLRTAAPWTDYEIRVFVGGKRDMIAEENIALGEDFVPFVETLLTGNMTSGSTTIPVADSSAFTAGAVMIHPNGNQETFELAKYTTRSQRSFGGLTRVYAAPDDVSIQWGKHSSGATVSEFFEITERVTRMQVDFKERDGVASWRVKLNGRQYDSFLLDNDNSVTVQLRMRPYNGDVDAWTPWQLWWLGYIKKCVINDDEGQGKQWTADVEGLSQYADSSESPARHYGKNDLAEGKTVTVSSYLADPALEWFTGEYLGYPSLDGDQVNDGDLGTLWISEGEPAPVHEGFGSSSTVNEVYLRPPVGYVQRDHQWIELAFKRAEPERGERLRYWSLANETTLWQNSDGDWDDYVPENNFIQLEGGGDLDTTNGDFVILTFNKPKFMERYPSLSGIKVFDVRQWITGTFTLDPAGGMLLLRNLHITTRSVVWWSDGNVEWEQKAPHEVGRDETSHWSGPMIPTPPAGHSFRRLPSGNAPDISGAGQRDNQSYWEMDERHPTPGYHTTGEEEWLSVDLGEMGISLEQEIGGGETSKIWLDKKPLGLKKTGMVRVNQEIISYLNRNDDDNTLEGLLRGQGETAQTGHPEGSVVLAQDTLTSDPSPNYLVSSISWRRKMVRDGGTGVYIVPNIFDVYVSPYIDPVMPGDDDWEEPEGGGGWEDYWDKIHTVGDWSDTVWIGVSKPARVRHVLMIIKGMSDDGRAKINQFSVWADTVDLIEIPPEADEGLEDLVDDAAYSGAIIFNMLTRDLGLAASHFILEDEGRPFIDLHTTTSMLMQLIRDICRRTGTSVVFGLDGIVTHRFDPIYPLAGLETIETTWDRDNAQKVTLTRPFRHNVKQMVIRAHESENEETFEAKYPVPPMEFGSTIELEDWVLTDPNDAQSMAEYMFRQKNAPLTAIIQPVGPAEWVRPGQRHIVNWVMDEKEELLRNRNFVVVGVQWHLNFGGGNPGAKEWRTTINLKELIF